MTASIIVVPASLAFTSTSPKQTFDIYNVQQFPIRFNVKSTAPEKYNITTIEGMISPQCKVTVEVTHVDICVTNENVRDILRIFFSQRKNKKFEPIGHRDVNAVLYSTKKAASLHSGDSTSSQDIPQATRSPSRCPSRSITPSSQLPLETADPTPVEQGCMPGTPLHSPTPLVSFPSYLLSTDLLEQLKKGLDPKCFKDMSSRGTNTMAYIVPIFLGILALWLPTQGTVEGTPWYLELSVNTKIAVGFFLGILVTLFYSRAQQIGR